MPNSHNVSARFLPVNVNSCFCFPSLREKEMFPAAITTGITTALQAIDMLSDGVSLMHQIDMSIIRNWPESVSRVAGDTD